MNKKGESIAETIIALTILAIGITISSTLVSSASRNMLASKNRIIAMNVAREGLEAVRNMRDTNWLKFSNNLRLCWNHEAGSNSAGGVLANDLCDGNHDLLPGEYIFYKNDEFGWKPSPTTIASEDVTLLHYMDIDTSTDTDLDGDPENDKDILNHPITTHDDSLGTPVSQSIFRRHIIIEYLENAPDTSTSPSNEDEPNDSINTTDEWNNMPAGVTGTSSLNRWRVTSVVDWNDRGRLRSLELQTILTDHFGRTNLTD